MPLLRSLTRVRACVWFQNILHTCARVPASNSLCSVLGRRSSILVLLSQSPFKWHCAYTNTSGLALITVAASSTHGFVRGLGGGGGGGVTCGARAGRREFNRKRLLRV